MKRNTEEDRLCTHRIRIKSQGYFTKGRNNTADLAIMVLDVNPQCPIKDAGTRIKAINTHSNDEIEKECSVK